MLGNKEVDRAECVSDIMDLYFKGYLQNNKLSDNDIYFDVIKFGSKEKSFFPPTLK